MKVKPIGEPYRGRQTYGFICPGCAQFDEPGSRLNAMHSFCDGPDGWTYNGNGERPTVSPSIKLTRHDGRICHSFIENGCIRFCGDSTHALAGHTVELPEYDR